MEGKTLDLTDLSLAASSGKSGAELGAGAKSVKGTAQQSGDSWKVPELDRNFNIDNATQQAITVASAYMNNVLGREAMQVQLQQDDDQIVGVVSDKLSQQEINRYDGMQILKLYAYNEQRRGIIADGNV